MSNTIDPHAFAIAIELANQLSSDGAFVDEPNNDMDGDYVSVSSNDIETHLLDNEGVLVFREAIPDRIGVDTPTESAATRTVDADTAFDSSSSLAWWSLIEHLVDVSPEDLLAMDW